MNITYFNNFIFNKTLEMVVVNSNISCSQVFFLWFCNCKKTLNIFNFLQKTSRLGRWMLKSNYISSIRNIKGIILHIYWTNAIYSISVVLRAIFFCWLLQHNNRHLTYIIMYPKCVMIFSASLTSVWAQLLSTLSSA